MARASWEGESAACPVTWWRTPPALHSERPPLTPPTPPIHRDLPLNEPFQIAHRSGDGAEAAVGVTDRNLAGPGSRQRPFERRLKGVNDMGCLTPQPPPPTIPFRSAARTLPPAQAEVRFLFSFFPPLDADTDGPTRRTPAVRTARPLTETPTRRGCPPCARVTAPAPPPSSRPASSPQPCPGRYNGAWRETAGEG